MDGLRGVGGQVTRNGAGTPVGVVLAGGASRRMGRDKATLVVDGERLAEGAAERLAAICGEVVIADRGRGVVAGRPSLPDGPGAGPAAGILGVATARPGRRLLVLACDLPGVTPELLRELARPGPWDWVVPRGPRGPEPLCALYAPSALEALARQVAAGRLAPRRLARASGLRVRWLEGGDLRRLGDPAALLRNLNEPGDLES